MTGETAAPLLRVVKGAPTDEELAALVGVVASLTGGSTETSSAVHRSAWSDPVHRVRGVHRHGPGAWRSSALPR